MKGCIFWDTRSPSWAFFILKKTHILGFKDKVIRVYSNVSVPSIILSVSLAHLSQNLILSLLSHNGVLQPSLIHSLIWIRSLIRTWALLFFTWALLWLSSNSFLNPFGFNTINRSKNCKTTPFLVFFSGTRKSKWTFSNQSPTKQTSHWVDGTHVVNQIYCYSRCTNKDGFICSHQPESIWIYNLLPTANTTTTKKSPTANTANSNNTHTSQVMIFCFSNL